MEIVISEKSADLLDNLRYQLFEKFVQFGRDDIAEKLKDMDYDDIIKCLHLGFSEKSFFESMKGQVIIHSFDLTNKDIDKISLNIFKLITGGT